MVFLPTIPYPDNEKPKLALLENLFRDWHKHFANNASSLEPKHVADDMVFDGFYPYYFNHDNDKTAKRILFIGWESRQIGTYHNMDKLWEAYHETKLIGDRPLNTDKFHYRMLRIAHGIINGIPHWDKIPSASDIGDTVGTSDGLSFAFMNISKLSNESESRTADWPVIRTAYALSTQSRNFIQEEVAILEPDVVIAMNLIDYLADGLDSLGPRTLIHASEGRVNSFWLDTNGHRSLLIDSWHFSASNKEDVTDFYSPICDAIHRSEAYSTA